MSTVLKKLHELRPGFQAFLSKNGGCELSQADTHTVPAKSSVTTPLHYPYHPPLQTMPQAQGMLGREASRFE